MCSGRVDPYLVLQAFIEGADGVFIGACLHGECHYTTGNFHAQGRAEIIQHVLTHAGLNPDRLVFHMMSSAEGGKFVQFAGEFIDQITEMGPIGKTEKITQKELFIKLTAAKNAMEGKKLRWVMGKQLEFNEEGNLYGEVFTEHELKRMFEEVVMDECTIQEILLRTRNKAISAKKLSEQLKLPATRVVRHLVDLRKVGLVELDSDNGDGAVWRAV